MKNLLEIYDDLTRQVIGPHSTFSLGGVEIRNKDMTGKTESTEVHIIYPENRWISAQEIIARANDNIENYNLLDQKIDIKDENALERAFEILSDSGDITFAKSKGNKEGGMERTDLPAGMRGED